MTIFTDEIDELVGVTDTDPGVQYPLPVYGALGMVDHVRFGEGFLQAIKRYTEVDSFGIGIAPVQTPLIRPGRIISEVVRLQETLSPALRYTWTVSEQLFMAEALKVAVPRVLTDGIGVAQAFAISLAVTVLQGLGIAPTPLPSLRYTKTLLQGIGVSDLFRNFFGAGLVDGIGIAHTLAKQFRPQPQLADGIGIAPALTNHFYIRVTLADTVGIDDSSLLQMIYDGQLADGIEVVAGYVSPDGQFSTWAINTRTSAVTEYRNYAFNSFAKVEDVYYGANANGLYKLIGDNDDDSDIIADIKSGFAQWAGAKFAMIRDVYLGARGGGDFVLKLITGDGNTYIYTVTALNQRTTKITIGKGLRARYFAFDLISTGQDFDLDTIEFRSLISDRRV